MALRFACISKNKTNPAYEGARIGAGRVAERLGASVDHYTPGIPDDIDQQEGLLRHALDSAPDAILISPAHPSALDGTLRDVLAADIPLIYFVCSSNAVPASTFITSDNYSLAFRIADYLITALGGKGNLVLLEGAANSPTSAPRTQGFLDAMAPHSDITCAAQARGDYQLADARDAMARILVENPTIHGVLAANDFMAMGVIEALEAAEAVGPSTPVVGINAMPKAISAIQQGRLLATAAFDAMAMACIAAEAAHRVILGEAVPPVIELPVEIVDGSNCGQWDLPYEQRPLPDWASATSA